MAEPQGGFWWRLPEGDAPADWSSMGAYGAAAEFAKATADVPAETVQEGESGGDEGIQ